MSMSYELWTRSYYCETVEHISESTVKKYIEGLNKDFQQKVIMPIIKEAKSKGEEVALLEVR